LFTFLASSIITSVLYFFLVVFFNDSLHILEKGGLFLGVSVAEVCGIFTFSILYMVSFFLPLYHIQKEHIKNDTTGELFSRFMPFVTLIASVFAFFVLLISGPENGIEGEGWINMWLFFILSYSGLIAFVYRIKKP